MAILKTICDRQVLTQVSLHEKSLRFRKALCETPNQLLGLPRHGIVNLNCHLGSSAFCGCTREVPRLQIAPLRFVGAKRVFTSLQLKTGY